MLLYLRIEALSFAYMIQDAILIFFFEKSTNKELDLGCYVNLYKILFL